MSDDGNDRTATHQILTATAFVEIVETLVGEFDVIDVLTTLASRCVDLLGAAAAGILLADSDGHLRVIGASTEQIQLLELFQVQNDEGPCFDCFHTGEVVLHSDLDAGSPWPLFAAECTAAGYGSVCALPLRLKSHVLGCVNIFMSESGGLFHTDVAVAQALADVASIAIVQDQWTHDAVIREGHLQYALDSRIVIEQAKGMIAERNATNMDEAFARLRSYARANNIGLTAVAEGLIDGTTSVAAIGHERSRRPPPPPRTDPQGGGR